LNEIDRDYYKDETGAMAGLHGSVPLLDASAKNQWGDIATNPPYFEIVTSTKGYEDIALSALIGGSKKGPYSYVLSYSLDGETFTNVERSQCEISDNKIMMLVYNEFALPDALDDKDKVYIRITVATDETISGENPLSFAPDSGAAAINDVKVMGVALENATEGSANASESASVPRYEPEESNFSILVPLVLSFIH
ncbi:MAG: hypothetical protein Q4C12_03650, partial [Clostridia bacterium]|nr:hypothetical protein [Clostridia bacterium]